MDNIANIELYPKVGKVHLENTLSTVRELGGDPSICSKAGEAITIASRIAIEKIPRLERILGYVDLLFVYALKELDTSLQAQRLDIAGVPTQIYAERMERHEGVMSGNGSCAHYLGTVDPRIEGKPNFRYLVQASKPRVIEQGLQAAVTTFHNHIKNTEGFRLAAGKANIILHSAGSNPIIKELGAGILETVLPKTYHQVISIIESDNPVEYSALTTLLMSHYENPASGLPDHFPIEHPTSVRQCLNTWFSQFNIDYHRFFSHFPNHQCYNP